MDQILFSFLKLNNGIYSLKHEIYILKSSIFKIFCSFEIYKLLI